MLCCLWTASCLSFETGSISPPDENLKCDLALKCSFQEHCVETQVVGSAGPNDFSQSIRVMMVPSPNHSYMFSENETCSGKSCRVVRIVVDVLFQHAVDIGQTTSWFFCYDVELVTMPVANMQSQDYGVKTVEEMLRFCCVVFKCMPQQKV